MALERRRAAPFLFARATTAPLSGTSARQFVLVTRLVVDVTAILGGLLIAEAFQHRLSDGGLAHPLGPVAGFNVIVLAAWLAIGAMVGLYDSRKLINSVDECNLIMHAATGGTVAATFASVLLKVPTQRSWVVAVWTVYLASSMVGRMAHRQLLRAMRMSGGLVNRLLIVGGGKQGRELYETVSRGNRWLGFQVVGFVTDPAGEPPALPPGYPPVVGEVDGIRHIARVHAADAVLIAQGALGGTTAERVYRDLQGLPVDLHLTAGPLGVAANRVAVQRFGDLPVLGLRRVELSGWQQALKRLFDLVLVSGALVVLSPLLLVCAVAVRLSGPGPILFKQTRVGQHGREFTIHKFRSMVIDAEERLAELRERNEADGLLFKLADDPRVTRVGKFMRSWSLDELPQLFDVLRGDMSLVGPRPPLPSEVAQYDAWLRNRLRVKPGMTGMWQISGRHETSFDQYVRHDLFYVENWSLPLDLFIVLRTIPAVLRRSGV
jgi:exopolysaccharide biosynthesis polyprenyl glycosylphosphotransferase